MARAGISGLRVGIVSLVLIALIPALGVMLHTASQQRWLAAVEVQENALRLARFDADR